MTRDQGRAMLAPQVDAAGLNAVRALERRRIEATRANDVQALAPLLHDQLIYVNSAGEIYDKERYLHGIGTHALSYDRDFDVHETHARALDDLVVLAGMMLGHSRLDGEQQVFHFPCIGVWRKEAGDWQMIAWQSSSGSAGF
jgi:ketosteroid isomerase-like protein